MGRKTKINVAGQFREATLVSIISSHEQWSEYILEDGAVIRMKIVITEVYRVDGLYDNDGNPVYQMKSNNVVSAVPSEDLKRIPGES